MFPAVLYILQSALAGTVVLHSSDDTDAVRAAVLEHSDLQVGDFTMTHLDAFRTGTEARWSGLAGLQQCEGAAVDSATVTAQVESAEESLLYMEMEKASDVLTQAQSSLVCLGTIVPRKLGGRIGFLRGVLSLEDSGDKASAFEHFSYAVRFQPRLTWDEQFADDGARTLLAAQRELQVGEPVALTVYPALPETSPLYVNGVPAVAVDGSVPLHIGENLIQMKTDQGVLGVAATAETGSTPTVFIPSALPDDLIENVVSEEGRTELTRVVDLAFEEDDGQIYVTHDDRLWKTASGFGVWKELSEAPAVSIRRGPPRRAWVFTGVTAAVASASVAALMLGEKEWGSGADLMTTSNDYAREGKFNMAEVRYAEGIRSYNKAIAGYAIASIGAAITVSGIVITIPMFNQGER